jgi:hypothetical protein
LAQEDHGFDDPFEIDMKIGSRKPEDDADVVLIEHDGIDEQASLGVLQRDDEWQDFGLGRQMSDEIGSRTLEKDGSKYLDVQET